MTSLHMVKHLFYAMHMFSFFFGTVKIIRNLSLSTTTPVLLLLKLYTHLKASNLIK